MRTSKKVSKIVNRINRQDDIDWSSWEAKNVVEALNFFLRSGLCKKSDDFKTQYNIFLVAFYKIDRNIEKILSIAIDKTPGLKAFMGDHSIFDSDTNKKGDWLQRFMMKKLMPTNKEVYDTFHPEPVPQELLNKFRIFDPVQVVLEMDPIVIQYGMWRKGHTNRMLDPINITYTDFDNFEFVKPEDIAKEIAKYTHIESDPVPVGDDDWLVEDDLPF